MDGRTRIPKPRVARLEKNRSSKSRRPIWRSYFPTQPHLPRTGPSSLLPFPPTSPYPVRGNDPPQPPGRGRPQASDLELGIEQMRSSPESAGIGASRPGPGADAQTPARARSQALYRGPRGQRSCGGRGGGASGAEPVLRPGAVLQRRQPGEQQAGVPGSAPPLRAGVLPPDHRLDPCVSGHPQQPAHGPVLVHLWCQWCRNWPDKTGIPWLAGIRFDLRTSAYRSWPVSSGRHTGGLENLLPEYRLPSRREGGLLSSSSFDGRRAAPSQTRA
jgi:hypothetical protein